jgi:hypothetical protein
LPVAALGVLAQLAEFAGYYRAGSAGVVRALLRLLPGEDMPRLRRAVESGEAVSSADLLVDYWDECRQAVDRRRHPPSIADIRTPKPVRSGAGLVAQRRPAPVILTLDVGVQGLLPIAWYRSREHVVQSAHQLTPSLGGLRH